MAFKRRESGRETGLFPGVLLAVLILGAIVLCETLAGAAVRPFSPSSTRTLSATAQRYFPVTLVSFPVTGENVVTRVYDRASPTVVNIVATTLEMNFWMEVVPRSGQGSGFIIDPRGYILTNNHVVENARRLEVTLADGEKVKAKLVGRDPSTDLAVIKIPAEPGLKVAVLGDSDRLQVGQMAIAIGNPFGLQHTVTVGVVSALNRELSTGPGTELRHVIQTDASINPGNSGGPLLNSRGEVIGINTAIYSTTGGAQGIGFAIPINTAKRVARQLIERGRVARPWLGIAAAFSLTTELAKSLKLPVRRGVVIAQLYRGGPAEKAGLRGGNRWVIVGATRVLVGGDIIVRAAGKSVARLEDLIAAVQQRPVGAVVPLEIVRGRQRLSLSVRLEEAPPRH